ncbi:MAG: metal-dependent hydrolase [Desulfovibrio sp.]|nr:metal-dependent hydrolase [Desulfovibrio sp.]
MAKITWYGHSAFKIETDGKAILIDPFFAPGSGFVWQDAGKIDLVLITHDHGDHTGDALAICLKWGAKLGCVVGTAQTFREKGLSQSQILNGIGFNIGGSLIYGNTLITMTQAFHSSDSGVPVGYILRLADGPTIYHAGDTGIFSSMKLFGSLYNIDLALLPIGGVFTMDAWQAANACSQLGCRTVIPMHWGTFPVLAQTPDVFLADLARIAPQCECRVMTKGVPAEFPGGR